MAHLVKFREIIDWDESGATKYGPVYIDIDKIQYICPHADGDPKHCTVTLHDSWTVGLAVDMDHLANIVNKVVTGAIPTCTPEQYTQELMDTMDAMIRAKERLVRAERQIDNGRC